MLTENGTFIINGTERVIVSQLHRSPGVFFQAEENKTLFTAKLIPYRGSWVEFEYDTKNILYVRIDRKRKFLGTIFLRALGYKLDEEIMRLFYQSQKVRLDGKKYFWKTSPGLVNHKVKADILDPKTDDVIVRKGKRVSLQAYQKMVKSKIHEALVDEEELKGIYALSEIVDKETGEVLVDINGEITPELLERMAEAGVDSFEFCVPEYDDMGNIIVATLDKDPISQSRREMDETKKEKARDPQHEALIEIYKRMRPGDPPTRESSESLFKGMFEDPRRYDISRVGRLKFNTKLGTEVSLDQKVLSREDFVLVIKYLMGLRKNVGELDDIDHLGNRRVRSVGELLENQFRIGLIRMERAIKEKMSVYQEMTTAMPHDLINAKPVMAAIQEFFGSSQLSQFMDQTNPLSEVTHKRRLSALGPGGLSRERAGFEVRDVHATHYGRICPIETPEGPNIGLISSLSCYARINEFGFIESPYKRVEKGRVLDYVIVTNAGGSKYKVGDIVEADEFTASDLEAGKGKRKRGMEFEPYSYYLSAWEEDQYIIAQANAQVDENGKFTTDRVNARQAGNFILSPRDKVEFIDVSPKQLVSVAASLVPFLENDVADGAVLGSK